MRDGDMSEEQEVMRAVREANTKRRSDGLRVFVRSSLAPAFFGPATATPFHMILQLFCPMDTHDSRQDGTDLV